MRVLKSQAPENVIVLQGRLLLFVRASPQQYRVNSGIHSRCTRTYIL